MIDKLIEQIKNKNSHVCVGLDPQLKFIPEEIKDEVFAEYGPTLEAVADLTRVLSMQFTILCLQ